MKLKPFYILLLIIFFSGCDFGQKSKKVDLHVIDLSKNYPEKVINLRDIADIEYIPLETTDDVLLGRYNILYYFSDKYMVILNPIEQDIFVFDRKGKIVSHFNKKGQGPQEYIQSDNIIFDEKSEEIFVVDVQRKLILVYSTIGEYKRTLNCPSELKAFQAINFDDDVILIYDNVFFLNSYSGNEKPYLLLSKRDGNIVSHLNIQLSERYTTRAGNRSINTPFNMHYGEDIVIGDRSSDTIYLFTKNRELKPLLTRIPSVHSSDPTVVWTPILTTDKYIFLHVIKLDYAAAEKSRIEPTILMYEFETGLTSTVTLVSDFRTNWLPDMDTDISKNKAAGMMIQFSTLKSRLEKGELRSDLTKLIETLDEGDNPVVEILTFK